MKKKIVLQKKIFAYFVALFFLALFSFGIYSLVTALISLGEVKGWDGVTVATNFSLGNGSLENPYVIQDPSEFVYFKQLIVH